ncbi:MAG: tRNA-dihydrouridine synthase [Candidatus Shapirobacteria bacterium]
MTQLPVLERMAYDIPEIGILTTKSISLDYAAGNREPILANMSPGNWINAVKLPSPGAEKFAEGLSKLNKPENRFVLASIVGKDEEKFCKVAEIIAPHVDGLEINISCPHGVNKGQTIAQDRELVTKIFKGVKRFGKPVVGKLSPKFYDEESINAVLKGGADGIAAINTWGPEHFEVDGHRVLTSPIGGGLSGKQILEKGIEAVREIRKRTSLPIIGSGGISTAQDVYRYRDAGADYFGVGSAALPGMNTEEIRTYFKVLNKDVENGTNFAEALIKTELNTEYEKIKVKEIKQIADDLFSLKFKEPFEAKAGQFVMLWSPREGEKPFSVYNNEPFEILFQTRGCFTEYLSNLEPGNELYVRGPYGNSPKVEGKLLLVGGGTGIAALKLFAKENPDSTVLIGAKDSAHIPDMSDWNTKNIIIYTEDGSLGKQGFFTNDLKQIIRENKIDTVMNCGPKGMLEAVLRIEIVHSRISLPNIHSSEELLTMCGVGICGRCVAKNGLRSCVDGTFI